MSLIQAINDRYRQDKITTLFMGAILIFAILSFIKPNSPLTFSGLATYIGISLINLLIILLLMGGILYFLKNKH